MNHDSGRPCPKQGRPSTHHTTEEPMETQPSPLAEDQLDDIETRAATLHEYATLTDVPLQADADQLTGTDVPALLAEVRRLRADAAAEILPAWEAVYEPGNVSDYLIGYANDEAPAKAAAEAWMRSQAEVTGRLEWVPEERLATGRYDQWFELIERHDDEIDTGPGLIVRRRVADEAQQPETQAQPPYHRWYVETRDGVADQWAPGMRLTERAEAVERYEALNENHPTWKDGTPVERRLVRETTTYTIEQEA